KKSVMNGKWITETAPLNYPVIFTINQGAFSAQEEIYIDIDEDIISYEEIEISDDSYTSLNISSMDDDNSSIEDAEVVIGAGRGAEDEDVIELIHEFAKFFKNGGVGASRPLCDAGIFPYSHQIGETGKVISPKLYIACGVSGSNQHIAGVRQAQEIIAINKDPQAAIFQIADIGVVASLEEFLPILLGAL
ncbi:MAG: electron transfer flavoprotein subunit alpha/FixB family protein, partial [Deltaproteobacteria bacterium]|nr:electron transfer flavoprotein subunit alpha/FixB family protein [Deltaproteobacteria bacterium]